MARSQLVFREDKITIATLMAMVTAPFLGPDYPLFPAMAACFCISPSFQSSLKRFEMEIKLTVFATLIALGADGIDVLEQSSLGRRGTPRVLPLFSDGDLHGPGGDRGSVLRMG